MGGGHHPPAPALKPWRGPTRGLRAVSPTAHTVNNKCPRRWCVWRGCADCVRVYVRVCVYVIVCMRVCALLESIPPVVLLIYVCVYACASVCTFVLMYSTHICVCGCVCGYVCRSSLLAQGRVYVRACSRRCVCVCVLRFLPRGMRNAISIPFRCRRRPSLPLSSAPGHH